MAQSVEHLPLAQVMIPGSWDWAPNQPPCSPLKLDQEEVVPNLVSDKEPVSKMYKEISKINLKIDYLNRHGTKKINRSQARGRVFDRNRSRLHAGSPMRTRSRDPGVTPWAKGRCVQPPRSLCFTILATYLGAHSLNTLDPLSILR